MLLSKIYVSITWRISLSNPLSRLVSAGANLQPYAPRLMAVGSTRVILKFGREGETCALRGHTAPLQTATATTYGPTSLYNFWSRRWVLPPYGHGPEPCALLCLPLLDKFFGVIFGSCTRTFCFTGKNALYIYTNITIT